MKSIAQERLGILTMNDSSLKRLLQKEMTRKDFLGFTALAVVSLIGVGGVITELLSHAATPYASEEAENGMIAGDATVVDGAVQFGGTAITMASPVLPAAPTHEAVPTKISWGNFPGGGPSQYVLVNSARYMNIFPTGAAITLSLTSSTATNWTCRDIYGNTSSGSVSGKTLIPTPPAGGSSWPCGWYRLAFTKSGANVSGGWGDQCGDGTFFVMNDAIADLPGPSQFPNGVSYSDRSYGTWVPPLATACGTIPARWVISDTKSPTTGNTDADPYDGVTTQSMVEMVSYDANWFLKYGTANRPHQDFIEFENGSVDVVNVTANSVETTLGAGAPFTLMVKTTTQVYVASTTAGTVHVATSSGGAAVETFTGSTWGSLVNAINSGSSLLVAYSSSSGTTATIFSQATIINSGFVGIASVVAAVSAQAATSGVVCPAFEGPYNEPDNDPVLCAAQMVAFKAAVDSAHAGATVLGPMTVTINGGMFPWISQFFAACKNIGYVPNALSFHGYNVVNGDVALADHCFSVFNAALATAGFANVPIWMTEGCGEFVNNFGALSWRNMTHWYAIRMLLYEVHGVPLERQTQYYMSFFGYNYPAWLKSGAYGQGPVCHGVYSMWRGFIEHTANASQPSRLSFPGAAVNLFFGSVYTTPSNKVIALITTGSPNGSVAVNIGATTSATIYDWAGNTVATTSASGSGLLTVAVSDLPTYVVVPSGTTVSVSDANEGLGSFTQNLALSAAAYSSSTQSIAAINNGLFEDGHYYSDGNVGTAGDAANPVQFRDNTAPTTWFVLEWKETQLINRVLLFSAPGWQDQDAPLAFTVYTWNGSAWVQQYSYTNATAISESFMTSNDTWQSFTEQFWDGAHNFDIKLSAPVMTNGVRVDITNVSYGSDPDNAAGSGNAGQSGPAACMRDIQVY
jgi:hypothetical protein